MQVKVRVTVERVLEVLVSNFDEAADLVRNNINPPEGTTSVLVIDERVDGTKEFRRVI